MGRLNPRATDKMRPEYKRSDFGALVRGKYAARIAEESNSVVLKPEVVKISPSRSENLRTILRISEWL